MALALPASMATTMTLTHDSAAPRTINAAGEHFDRMMRPCHFVRKHAERGAWYADHLNACGYRLPDGSPVTASALRSLETP